MIMTNTALYTLWPVIIICAQLLSVEVQFSVWEKKKDKSSCIFSLFAKDREDFSLPD